MIRRFFQKVRSEAPEARDTDLDWTIIGETEPYFGVLTSERYKRKNLNFDAQSDFFRSGYGDVQNFIDRMRAMFGVFDPRSALDFGCGVGRLTLPLAELTGTATGIDISPGMLSEARKRAHPGLRFLSSIPDEEFDWVVSTIVFQHIPPARGYDIIANLLARVRPNGGATIQIMFGRNEAHQNTVGARLLISDAAVRLVVGTARHEHIPVGVMIMHDYDLSVVVGLFYQAGLKRLFLDHCDHGGIIGATIYGRKEPDITSDPLQI